LVFLPNIITNLGSTRASMDRIQTLLLSEEVDVAPFREGGPPGNAITVQACDFGWEEEADAIAPPTLPQLQLDIKQGSHLPSTSKHTRIICHCAIVRYLL
jgi:hypothetical protein